MSAVFATGKDGRAATEFPFPQDMETHLARVGGLFNKSPTFFIPRLEDFLATLAMDQVF